MKEILVVCLVLVIAGLIRQVGVIAGQQAVVAQMQEKHRIDAEQKVMFEALAAAR